MSRVEECRHDGCTRPPLDQAIFCGEHIGATHKCKATKPGTDGKVRCKKYALAGLDVCERHGGRFPYAKKQSARSKALTKMQRFVKPYEGELDPVGALEMEFRRCLGRIAWLDEEIGNLQVEDLTWGKTKHESAGGFEGAPSTTYEARIHIYEEMQRWERKHLLEMEKLWIAAGIEKERLRLMESQVAWTFNKVVEAMRAMGIDPFSEANRSILAQVFETGPAPAIEVRQL